MIKDFPDRPEHIPREYEWLPDAYERDVVPYGPEARERIRYALGEGDIEATLLLDLGHLEPIDERMWRKTPIAKKVLPRFRDGRITMGLHPYRGPKVSGWVLVPKGSLSRYLSEPQSPPRRSGTYSQARLESWYKDYIRECRKVGDMPSEVSDLQAARSAFDKDIPRQAIRDLRKRLAPDLWKKPGRRPTKSRQK